MQLFTLSTAPRARVYEKRAAVGALSGRLLRCAVGGALLVRLCIALRGVGRLGPYPAPATATLFCIGHRSATRLQSMTSSSTSLSGLSINTVAFALSY